jgi:Glycosyltransferases involved in cell wall biogenesis
VSSTRISIIVTAHNYAEYLPRCLDSALDQTYPADNYEIVVVDDGSSDETPDLLSDYRFEHPEMIRTIRLEGEGLPSACNAGIKAAEGEYIVRLDADDYFDENILTVEAKYLDENPDISLVYPDYYTVDNNREILDHVRNPRVEEEINFSTEVPWQPVRYTAEMPGR